jgi:hypothetical protein
MDYMGIEYCLVQTIAPSGWRWSFLYLGHEFSGSGRTRHEAVRDAQLAIANLLRLKLTVHG